MMHPLTSYTTRVVSKKGILIGSDLETEWMLKWWWGHYQKYNPFPIAIVDFGMSQSALLWCKQIGMIIAPHFPKDPKLPRNLSVREKWERIYSDNVWQCRKAWFKKPLALLSSPFEQTIWIDLDCEILGFIGEIFSKAKPICLVKEPERSRNKEVAWTVYNSGVMGFTKPCPILEKWVENAQQFSENFLGDQDVLSWTMAEEKFAPESLSPQYNWRPACGENPEAKIIHHAGKLGKLSILQRLH